MYFLVQPLWTFAKSLNPLNPKRNLHRLAQAQVLNEMLKLFSSTIRNSTLLRTLKISTLEIPTSHFQSTIPSSNPAIQFILEEAQDDLRSSLEPIQRLSSGNGDISPPKESDSGVISHPWPEWVDLMEKLLKNGYFAGVSNPCLRNNELGNKDSNQIRTACMNFARDQFDLERWWCFSDSFFPFSMLQIVFFSFSSVCESKLFSF